MEGIECIMKILRRYLSFQVEVHYDRGEMSHEDMNCKKCGLIGIDWDSVAYSLEEEFLDLGAQVTVRIEPINKGDNNDNNS
tara:strand:- start:203 stop:445 length:243 start_codon:yes stop_codon:yes gene_type:complete